MPNALTNTLAARHLTLKPFQGFIRIMEELDLTGDEPATDFAEVFHPGTVTIDGNFGELIAVF